MRVASCPEQVEAYCVSAAERRHDLAAALAEVDEAMRLTKPPP
jgi:hypothetical protein